MSQARKQLKIISFVQVILMVAALVVGVAGIVSPSDSQAEAFGLGASTLSILAGISLIASGVFAFLAAAQGIKGANVPSKLGPHTPYNVIGVVASLMGVFLGYAISAAIPAVACLMVVADVAALTRGATVRKELDR